MLTFISKRKLEKPTFGEISTKKHTVLIGFNELIVWVHGSFCSHNSDQTLPLVNNFRIMCSKKRIKRVIIKDLSATTGRASERKVFPGQFRVTEPSLQPTWLQND
ncbi:hypothetical protein BpHYR1_000341 [Brachionus plicatilis]|uniref:Uncharacterized protein n=1 Tax=Brachionus plicatilis TaxID=10195 RepID=A0A3M7SC36_BRAPC|nr:hypothetical protein BpHYR1_000341 [Brachionus plicatilis]